MKITILGSGNVGGALADGLERAGHEVTLGQSGERSSTSLARALEKNPRLRVADADPAVREAEVVFLATPFQANEAVLTPLADALGGKVLVDCTNPVGPGLTHGLGSERSGASVVAALAPRASVVKAFSIYGFETIGDALAAPQGATRPVMLFCGDDAAAKQKLEPLIAALGWEPLDVGGLVQALHLEHMTLLWVRLVRAGGRSPHLVWSALRR
jgi:predicted dinucleotide-binding enzyme